MVDGGGRRVGVDRVLTTGMRTDKTPWRAQNKKHKKEKKGGTQPKLYNVYKNVSSAGMIYAVSEANVKRGLGLADCPQPIWMQMMHFNVSNKLVKKWKKFITLTRMNQFPDVTLAMTEGGGRKEGGGIWEREHSWFEDWRGEATWRVTKRKLCYVSKNLSFSGITYIVTEDGVRRVGEGC